MAKRKSYSVNGEVFITKGELEDRVRSIVNRYPDNQSLDWVDLAFMVDLLSNHPQANIKVGCGIASIYVQRNPIYKKNRGFVLVRTDGTETDFSWLECIKPTPHRKKVISACRALIESYTMEFKQQYFDERGGVSTCPFTGETIRFTGSHVDHAPPMTFEVIFDNFIKGEGFDIDLVELRDEFADNKYQDELADDALAAVWIEYHNKHAQLRVISAKANLSHVKVGR